MRAKGKIKITGNKKEWVQPFKKDDFDEDFYRVELSKICEEEIEWAYHHGIEELVNLIIDLEKKYGAWDGLEDKKD